VLSWYCFQTNFRMAVTVLYVVSPRPEVLKTWGAHAGGAVGPLGGHELLVRGTYLF
jgi:hypothetical protein